MALKRIIGIEKPNPPKPPPPSLNETIDSISKKEESYWQKIAQCDADLVKIREQMQKLRKGTPPYETLVSHAKRKLQQKKQYETMQENLAQQSLTVDQTISNLQNATVSYQVVETLRTSTKHLRKAQQKLKLDEIDELHENLEDLAEVAKDIQSAFNVNYNCIPDIDEDTLQEELDGILMDDSISTGPIDLTNLPSRNGSNDGGNTENPTNSGTSSDNTRSTTETGIVVDEFGLPILSGTSQIPEI